MASNGPFKISGGMLMEGCFKGHDWRKQLIQGMEIKSFWLDKIANQIIPQLQHSFSFAFHNSYFMFNIVWPKPPPWPIMQIGHWEEDYIVVKSVQSYFWIFSCFVIFSCFYHFSHIVCFFLGFLYFCDFYSFL